ncbi:MAG: polysaccharide biosynthesis tyrosine autokinase [Sphingomonadales bacterium]|nr:polysaccharide biosynthesis tyrosine autokinase [Sphingomonadales bacterium]MDE2567949.1 polysaccharide biosynthesis tyrosine autokinase [Sphingomonadales bacterium]
MTAQQANVDTALGAADDEYLYGESRVGFNLRQVLFQVRANIVGISIIVVSCVVLAAIVTMLQTPRYRALATVQINDQSAQVLGNQDDLTQGDQVNNWDVDRFLQTQVDVLRSRSLAERVAAKLRLVGNSKFYQMMGSDQPTADMSQDEVKEMTLDLLQDNLGVNLPRDSRITSVTFESTDPAFSAKVANTFVSEFIQANLQRRFDSSAYARDFLSQQLEGAKVKVEQSEQNLNDYARAAGLIRPRPSGSDDNNSLSSGSGNSVTATSLLELNTAANQAEANRIAAEERWRAISSGSILDSPDVLANTAVNQLLSERAKAGADLQQQRAQHLDDYPSVVQAKAQLAAINKQLNEVASNIRASVKQQYLAAQQAENELKAKVNALKSSTLSEQDRSVQYNMLAREADTNRELYSGLLQRYKELNAAAGITNSNISIIDQADPPSEPSSPKLARNLALALLGGIALAGVALFLRTQFDDKVRVPEDVEAKLGMPLLGIIPRTTEGDPLEALADPKSAISEGYNSLRGSLMYSTAHGLPRTLLVTSSQASEGKTTTSFAIASGLARLGRSVLLIDVDLRRPSLHKALGFDNKHGLSSLLTNQDTIEAAIRASGYDNLSVITSGPIPPSPTELLSSQRMEQLLDQLSERFDSVILDSSPVLGLADAPLMAALVDGVVMVIESDRGRRGSLHTSLRRLRGAHSHILGAVLTMFDPAKAANRYSDYYGYDYYAYSTRTEEA